MKKILSIFIAFWCTTEIVLCQTQEYRVQFNKSDFEIVQQKDGIAIKCNNPLDFYSEDTLSPALPQRIINILIPPNTKIKNISYETKKQLWRSNVNLFNNSQIISISQMGMLEFTSSKYKGTSFPEENLSYIENNYLQGFAFSSFVVTPFYYDATNKNLYFISDITIRFLTEESKESQLGYSRIGNAEQLKDLVINYNDIHKFYSTTPNSSKSIIDTVEYLIITSDDLKNSFMPLKAWKIQKGIRTEVITISEIYSNYNGATNQLKIKNCLLDYYENHALKYVLLGGDNTIIPVQGCYGCVANRIDYNIPCDLFYACFDKTFDWNLNGDEAIGEYTDYIDLNPEISISRLPVRTSEHLNSYFRKSFSYEKGIGIIDYADKMLLTGVKLLKNWNSLSDSQHWSEYMYSSIIQPNWAGIRDMFYDTETSFTGGANFDLTKNNLQSVIDSGYHIIHMATHGYTASWKTESDEYYGVQQAFSQKNNNSSIIVTIACNTNAFDSTTDPCLSEALIRNSKGGAILYWGSSREGWSSEDTTVYNCGASFDYSRSFFSCLFSNNNNSFGYISNKAKQQQSSIISPSYRWLQYSINAIGETELPIYTDIPNQFTNVTTTISNTTLTINSGVPNCTIAVTSNGDYGNSYFRVAKNVSTATFSNVPDNYVITIIKKNYIPYHQSYPADLYFQNCTINCDSYFYANNIYIGENVTSQKPQGEVYLNNNSNIFFEATNVLLNNGTEIELGTSVTIPK